MEKRNVELKRKFVHLLFGVAIVLLIKFEIIGKLHLLIFLIFLFLVSSLSKKYNLPGIYWFIRNFERDDYVKKFPGRGFIFYTLGSLLVLAIFPLDIALASILILAFADSIGHLFGIRFGKRKHPYVSTKFVEGWIAGLIAGFIAAYLIVPWHEAIIASFFAMLVEGIEVKVGADDIDDNLIIPAIAAIAIWAVRAVF
jgi:dolichol kinase